MATLREQELIELGKIMLEDAGEEACMEAYQTDDPYFVGLQALGYGDINEDGSVN